MTGHGGNTGADGPLEELFESLVGSARVEMPSAGIIRAKGTGRVRRRRAAMAVTSVAVIAALALVLVPSAASPRHKQDAGRPTAAIVHLTAATNAVTPATAADERAASVAEVQLSTSVLRASESGGALHNLAFDPLGMSQLFTETELGARGATAVALSHVLGAGSGSPAARAAGLGALIRSISSAASGSGSRWSSSNELLVSQSQRVSSAYLNELGRTLRTGVWWSNFAHDAASVRQAVNRWGDAAGSQSPLLSSAAVNAGSGLVGVSADRFSGSFENGSAFSIASTTSGSFTLANGSTVSCRLMHNATALDAAVTNGAEAVQLRLVGGKLSADVIMPTRGTLGSYLNGLTGARLSALLGAMRPATVNITMPRFSVSDSGAQSAILRSLGLGSATGRAADFSGVSQSATNGALRFSGLATSARLSVTESGINTAARAYGATSSSPPRLISAQFTHPFIFIVRDDSTGAILFESVIVDPASR